MPFTAKIKRGDPFRSADQREIYAMCRRIAGAAEHCSSAGWREESGYLLYHFTTWAKARAMQHGCGAIDMARRKGEDTIAAKRRRMPFVAKIRGDDPFRAEDGRTGSTAAASLSGRCPSSA